MKNLPKTVQNFFILKSNNSNIAIYFLSWLMFVLIFAGVFLWFKEIDIYHNHFFVVKNPVLHIFDNFLRLVFTLYLFIILVLPNLVCKIK